MITGLLAFPALIGLFVIWHLARAIGWLQLDESDVAPIAAKRREDHA